jgi:hypothetical protein
MTSVVENRQQLQTRFIADSVYELRSDGLVVKRPRDDEQHQSTKEPSSKKQRANELNEPRWLKQLQDLTEFRDKHGHCLVPRNFPENQALSNWVNMQRRDYKCKQQGKHSRLIDERERHLQEVGFIFDPLRILWEEKFIDLRKYKELHGNFKVPLSSSKYRALSTWVTNQRRFYNRLCRGESSRMTSERIAKLNTIGFIWDPYRSDLEEKFIDLRKYKE